MKNLLKLYVDIEFTGSHTQVMLLCFYQEICALRSESVPIKFHPAQEVVIFDARFFPF